LDDAQKLIAAGLGWAGENGLSMSMAVVDAGGHPVAMAKSDNSSILSAESVIQKARACVWLGRETASAVEVGSQWPVVYLSFIGAAHGGIVWSKGGVPIRRDGVIIGAIASSGGTGAQDEATSMAALSAVGYAAG
jgi:uncharacterized protein GlcG (DUF336 family)